MSLDEKDAMLTNDTAVLHKVKPLKINTRNDVVNVYAMVAGTGLQEPLRPILDRFTQLYNSLEELSYEIRPKASPALNKITYRDSSSKKWRLPPRWCRLKMCCRINW